MVKCRNRYGGPPGDPVKSDLSQMPPSFLTQTSTFQQPYPRSRVHKPPGENKSGNLTELWTTCGRTGYRSLYVRTNQTLAMGSALGNLQQDSISLNCRWQYCYWVYYLYTLHHIYKRRLTGCPAHFATYVYQKNAHTSSNYLTKQYAYKPYLCPRRTCPISLPFTSKQDQVKSSQVSMSIRAFCGEAAGISVDQKTASDVTQRDV